MVTLGRIPVVDILALRGINIPNTFCPMCNKENGSVDHVLVKCDYAKEVQEWIFGWCDIGDK